VIKGCGRTAAIAASSLLPDAGAHVMALPYAPGQWAVRHAEEQGGLAEALDGLPVDPDLVFRSLEYAIDPEWTRGHTFSVAYELVGGVAALAALVRFTPSLTPLAVPVLARMPLPAQPLPTEATHADLVAYLDADDWWEPRFLEATEQTLLRHPDAPATYTGIVKRYPDGRQTPFLSKPAMLGVREAIVRSHVYPSGLVVRRTALDAIGGWRRDAMIVEDWDLSVRLLDRWGPMPLVPELLVNYRVGNPSSLSAQHWNKIRRWRRTLMLNRDLVDRHFGPGAARRRLAQAFADRRDRVGGSAPQSLHRRSLRT